jgi:hypothetical protein
MLERGTRLVQIYHRGWDAHRTTPENHQTQCRDIDQACYGLITDLEARGMLEDTLVIWGGEFGRTVYCQFGFDPNRLTFRHAGLEEKLVGVTQPARVVTELLA